MKSIVQRFGGAPLIGAILVLALGIVAAMPLLSGARTTTISVTIVNNSAHEIRHLYLSPTNLDNWGPDQLGGMVIATGGTYTLNVSCSGSDIKLIAEDDDGCFFYRIVSCGESSSWTVQNDAARDCGN